MSERKPGWYWVHVYGNWEPAYTDDGDVFDHIDSRVDKVGPRIPTPDEPWQTVPVEPARHEWGGEGDRCVKCGDKDWFAGPVCSESKLRRQAEGDEA